MESAVAWPDVPDGSRGTANALTFCHTGQGPRQGSGDKYLYMYHMQAIVVVLRQHGFMPLVVNIQYVADAWHFSSAHRTCNRGSATADVLVLHDCFCWSGDLRCPPAHPVGSDFSTTAPSLNFSPLHMARV
jgi:hypothetical protein